ncbi:hypothetical protein BGZ95_010994 [Linnemannia exigua]|uniref:Septin-type G domain-containing protein n=1 Tax=Linnemannia exigua TaxID=604196 RepID=A0AAD4H6R6_9FUNG|nr:hypothetical protein BGZ95_010994 [Linnemannia exigua]
MPSSAMFVKSREPTVEGEQLGFVKLMVAGQSRVWNSRLIQDMFRWEGVIANDFDDEFLQDPLPDSDSSGIVTGGATTAANSAVGGGVSSNESNSFMEETSAGHHLHRQRKREHAHQQGQGVREAIVEHYASSMVLPAWARVGFDEEERNQEILVKNICIVDTPGYSAFNNPNRAMDLVISYLGLQFQTTNEFFSHSALSDESLGRFLANNSTGAHSHVDACLYVIEGALSEIDVQLMQRLQPWVNLIPVLIPSQNVTSGRMGIGMGVGDSSEAEMIVSARVELIRQLKEHDIHIYGMDIDSISTGHHPPTTSTSSNSSPFTTAESLEAALASPPLLVLDDSNSLSPEFMTPPFVFHVPPSLVEDTGTGVGQLDRDVLRLDVITKQGIGRRNDEDDSDNGGTSSLLPTVPQHRPSSAPGVQEDLPDLGPLRRWVYVNHLAALRHHTTQKFLSWRRHLPQISLQSPMESSQDSGSYRQLHNQQQQQRRYLHNMQGHAGQQGHGHGQQSLNMLSSDSAPGSFRPALSTATHSPPPSISVTQHHHHHHHPYGQQQYPQRALPTDLLSDLRVQDQRRISDKVVRMLETHGQIFERILYERQVAWRQALEGMEREQRIEFLMQELRRWANEGSASEGSDAAAKQHQHQQGRRLEGGTVQGQQQKRKLDVQYRVREGSRDSEWTTGGSAGGGVGGVTVGLGLEGTMGIVEPLPSLRDALSEPFMGEVSNSVRSINAANGRKSKSKSKHGIGGGSRDRGAKKSRSSKEYLQRNTVDVTRTCTSAALEPAAPSTTPTPARSTDNNAYFGVAQDYFSQSRG